MDVENKLESEVRERIALSKQAWHQRQARLSLPDKVRILLELQRQDYPLLQRRRPMRTWERPWNIEP
jgi:hypothetical protein